MRLDLVRWPKALPSTSLMLIIPIWGAGHSGDVEGRQAAAAGIGDLDLDLLVVQLARPQHLSEFGAGVDPGVFAHQSVQHPLLRRQLGLGVDLGAALFAHHVDCDLPPDRG